MKKQNLTYLSSGVIGLAGLVLMGLQTNQAQAATTGTVNYSDGATTVWTSPEVGQHVKRYVTKNQKLTIQSSKQVYGQTWYNLGNNEWVASQYVTAGATTATPAATTDATTTSTDTVTSNYKSGVTTVWSDPATAKPTGQYLTYGATKKVISQKVLYGTTWYQIEGNGWIPANYVALNNPSLTNVSPVDTQVATTTTTPAAQTANTTAQVASTSSSAVATSTPVAAQTTTANSASQATSVSSSAVATSTPATQTTTTNTSASQVTPAASSSVATSTPTQTQTAPAASSSVSTPAVSSSVNTSTQTTQRSTSTQTAVATSASTTSSSAAVTGNAQTVVNAALSQVGVPYVWGGTSAGVGLDCSGLVQYAYGKAGVSLAHYTVSQESAGSRVSISNLQAGDIIFWGNAGATYHDAIYIGGGKYVTAPQPGENVKVATISSYFMPSFGVHVL